MMEKSRAEPDRRSKIPLSFGMNRILDKKDDEKPRPEERRNSSSSSNDEKKSAFTTGRFLPSDLPHFPLSPLSMSFMPFQQSPVLPPFALGDSRLQQEWFSSVGADLARNEMQMYDPLSEWRKDRCLLTRRIGHPYQNRTPPKRKKPRTSFTRQQVCELEKRFMAQKYLASTERAALAGALNMSDAQVKTWFQNRRTKWRRQTAEEREAERQAAGRLFLSLASLPVRQQDDTMLSVSPVGGPSLPVRKPSLLQ